MYADTRSAIVSMEQANDLCQELDHPYLGIAVDVYHVWWDPHLSRELRRAGDGTGSLPSMYVIGKVQLQTF
jgi:sugar phosphate isomerase/epimerase